MTDFKPMLAGKLEDFAGLQFPVIASPKLDGIRCIILDGKAVTRTLKPIPNAYVRACLEQDRSLDGCDGELLLPDMTEPFSDVSSAIMSHDGEPEFTFAVFDWVNAPGLHFRERLSRLAAMRFPEAGFVQMVEQIEVPRLDSLMALHDAHLRRGFEGTMVRRPDSPYKQGRSTEREGYLLKMKKFEDEEAIVIGFVEEMHNTNAQTRNAVGQAERSTAKAGLKGKSTLGALKLRFDDGTEFECGTGFTAAQRVEIWREPERFIRQRAKIKHQPPPGGRPAGVKPRIPVFLGWRHD